MQKINSLIGCIIAALLLSNCSPKEFALGKYQGTSIKADGDASDWGLPLRFGDETGSLQYAVTNDENNIYVSVASNEKTTQMRMLRAGIKICIDPKGNKSTDMCLNYPFTDPMDMPKTGRNEFARNENSRRDSKNADPTAMRQKMMMDADMFSTTGFINMENRVYDLRDTSIIKVGMNFDIYNNLIFEAIIPIKQITNTTIPSKKTPSISVGIIVNSMGGGAGQKPGGNGGGFESNGMGGGMRGGGMGGGMRGGGMGGGMRGGGMGGGMRGGGMGGGMRGSYANDNSKPITNWYQFKLATQKDALN
jgi:hypothetical protein